MTIESRQLGLAQSSLGYRYVHCISADSCSSLSAALCLTLQSDIFDIQGNLSLRELLLGNNNITDSSSTDLIKALGTHPRLEKVLSRMSLTL